MTKNYSIRFVILFVALTFAALTFAQNNAGSPTRLANPVLKRCTVSAKDELRIPAQDSGVLMELSVDEGDDVAANAPLGKIDDLEAQVQKAIAVSAKARAKAESENEINIQYSIAAQGVAQLMYEKALEANKSAGGRNPPYPQSEIRRLKLDAERAGFQIDQARMDMTLAKLDENVRDAELNGAEQALARRQINAPFDGKIVNVYRRKGEWVQPGDPILWLMKFDTMKVAGSIDAREYDPSDIAGKPVSVTVDRARGRVVTLKGRVTYVNPVILGDNKYEVEAEVANIQEDNRWLVPHGAMAEMTIEVN